MRDLGVDSEWFEDAETKYDVKSEFEHHFEHFLNSFVQFSRRLVYYSSII